MPKFDNSAKIALIAAVVYIVVGYQMTYDNTQKLFGSIIKQEGTDYGVGNTTKNYGFLIHAAVMGLIMYLVLKYGLKL
jgi:hypothetical protein